MMRGMALAVLLCGATAEAQPLVLRGGTVHTVSGETFENGVLVMGADGRIAAVGRDAASPAGAAVLDVSGKVVTPGFIDVATQLGVAEILLVAPTMDADAGGDQVRAALLIGDSFNAMSPVIPIARTGGITSAVVAPAGGLISGRSAWVDLGYPDAPAAVIRSPLAMHVTLGEAAKPPLLPGSRSQVILDLRELYDDALFYRDHKKLADENRARPLAASRLDLEAIAPTVGGALPTAFTASRASDILAALSLAREFDLRPVILGGAEAWMIASELAAARVPVVLDPTVNLPFTFEMLGAREDCAARLHRAGVPVVISTFETHNARTLRQRAGNAVRAGLPHSAALAAVTLEAARAFGMDDLRGSIAPGKLANVVVWSGDPFELSTRVERVFIHGREVSLDTRQKALLERYRTLPR